jgi:GNAT superfamily N-acetyltransferase
VRAQPANEIAIVTFRPELAEAFAALNRAWIERFFTMEAADWKVLRDPEAAIVRPGGQIFFALDGRSPAGTVAVGRVSPTTYELAKMAVTPSHQGRGLGERLGRAAIAFAKQAGAELLFLETNSGLPTAIRLYERLGFAHAQPRSHSPYARADVYMELDLRPNRLTSAASSRSRS